MNVRFASEKEIHNWNNLVIANPDGGNVFSSYEFAMQKETGGYKARFVMADDLAITVLEKNTPPLGKFWYIPKGPGIVDIKSLWDIMTKIALLAKQHGVFAIRTEPELDIKYQPELRTHGLRESRPIIPNQSTITLDLSPSLNEIMSNLPQKGRYAIKRAEREGVKIKLVKSSDENCETMYRLLQETAKGQFGIRNYEYFKTFWQRFEATELGQMFFAYYDEKVVAGAYAITYGQKSTYKDGASIRKRTVYGASHLLQWKVIEWSKQHGSTLHDFCGSPPSGEINNPDHKHYGIGLFKTAFNKTVTDYVGCYDYIINKHKYLLWIKLGEKIAYRLHNYKHHDSYY